MYLEDFFFKLSEAKVKGPRRKADKEDLGLQRIPKNLTRKKKLSDLQQLCRTG